MVDRTGGWEAVYAPPMLVAVVGPPGVSFDDILDLSKMLISEQTGKTTIIKSLVRHYTKHSLSNPSGPITCVTSKKSRITLIETPANMVAMLDVAKIADLVILLIDGKLWF